MAQILLRAGFLRIRYHIQYPHGAVRQPVFCRNAAVNGVLLFFKLRNLPYKIRYVHILFHSFPATHYMTYKRTACSINQ